MALRCHTEGDNGPSAKRAILYYAPEYFIGPGAHKHCYNLNQQYTSSSAATPKFHFLPKIDTAPFSKDNFVLVIPSYSYIFPSNNASQLPISHFINGIWDSRPHTRHHNNLIINPRSLNNSNVLPNVSASAGLVQQIEQFTIYYLQNLVKLPKFLRGRDKTISRANFYFRIQLLS